MRNESFAFEHGIIVQEFVNPGGYHFELVTVTEADVLLTGQRVTADTFFLGFDWTIAVCPKCKNHIGWGFTPTHAPVGTEPTFYALIHEKLFYEMDGHTYVRKAWNT